MADMLEQIRSLGEQLRWASDLAKPAIGACSEVLYAGMGGSAIGGDYAAVVAEPGGTRITVHRGYGPAPAWAVSRRPLVLAASYSGNTEETLDFVSTAHEAGLQVAAVTTGGALEEAAARHKWPMIKAPAGKQPRAAIGLMLGAVLKTLEGSHALDDQRLAFAEAAELADRETAEGSESWRLAERIASDLAGRIPIIYGGGPVSDAAARRWKTQINENSKVPSWWSVLPELDHNELVGWEAMPEKTRDLMAIVALTDRGDHARVGARVAHTRALTESAAPWVAEVESSGTFLLTRLMSLTVVGDLVSWMLADKAGVDPIPVTAIENLKRLLAEGAE